MGRINVILRIFAGSLLPKVIGPRCFPFLLKDSAASVLRATRSVEVRKWRLREWARRKGVAEASMGSCACLDDPQP